MRENSEYVTVKKSPYYTDLSFLTNISEWEMFWLRVTKSLLFVLDIHKK